VAEAVLLGTASIVGLVGSLHFTSPRKDPGMPGAAGRTIRTVCVG
jgi:hypothetical protein